MTFKRVAKVRRGKVTLTYFGTDAPKLTPTTNSLAARAKLLARTR